MATVTGQPDEHGRDWLVLRTPDGAPQLAFQHVTRLREPDWPDGPVPQQMHLDRCTTSTSACSPSAAACSATAGPAGSR
ncbi:hypothetical protein [Streptomyces coeruleorubidus]|uniref:hypothetical protein n=1 Tax=Streptomyces coeruleorubidus TaxID=116188 RepID=UPI0036D13160